MRSGQTDQFPKSNPSDCVVNPWPRWTPWNGVRTRLSLQLHRHNTAARGEFTRLVIDISVRNGFLAGGQLGGQCLDGGQVGRLLVDLEGLDSVKLVDEVAHGLAQFLTERLERGCLVGLAGGAIDTFELQFRHAATPDHVATGLDGLQVEACRDLVSLVRLTVRPEINQSTTLSSSV